MNNAPYYSAEDLLELEAQKDKLQLFLETQEGRVTLEQGIEMVKIFDRLPMHQTKVLTDILESVRLKMALDYEIILDAKANRERYLDS